MDSGKRTVRELFNTVVNIDGIEYVELLEVEKYLKQQKEFEDALTTIRYSINQIGNSFVNLEDSIGNLKENIKGIKNK